MSSPKPVPEVDSPWLTEAEAAAYMRGWEEQTLANHRRAGKPVPRYVMLGRTPLYKREWLDEFLLALHRSQLVEPTVISPEVR